MKKLFVIASALLASTSQAAWPTLSASIGYESQIFTSRSYDLVDTNDYLPMFRVAAGTGFEVGPAFIDVDLAFTSGASRETAHSIVPTELWLRGVQVGGTYRYPVLRWLHPYAHVGLGWDWATLTMFSEARMTQTVSNFAGTGLLGVQLPVRMGIGNGRLPFMVFDIGGGYVVRPDYAFNAVAPKPNNSATDPVGQGSVNLGSLPMHGATFRVLVSIRW